MIQLDDIRKKFNADKYAVASTGCYVDEVRPGYARCSLTIDKDRHMNGAGAVMGGVMFTLADFAFAVATDAGDTQTVSLSSQITYLGPVRGTMLVAEAVQVKSGRSTCFYTITVNDNLGNQVASVSITGFIKGHP
jgi:acyl-CoA thioesterase